MRWLKFPVVMVAAMLAAPMAQAQVDSREAIALQNQIYQLRQDMQTMMDRGGSGPSRGSSSQASVPNELVAQLLTRVDALEEQVRQLRGRMDEQQNMAQRQNAELNKKIDDLAFQMSNGAGAPNAPVAPPLPAPGAKPAAPPPPAAAAPRTPEIAMQQGSAALARRDYPAAEQAAREVLANRTSPKAYDAQLLLAQALSGQRQFPQAAIAYDDAYNRSRKGVHAPDALLGLANSLTAINEKKAACDTLVRLQSEFPQPRGDLRESIAAAHQRAGCR